MKRLFGLIGFPLSHSFSPAWFTEKFFRENIKDCEYQLFPLQNIEDFDDLIRENDSLCGLNVTIPYKQSIIPFLDLIDEAARDIGAVNTISFHGGVLKGHNTDCLGFRRSIEPLIKPFHKKALILGTGGSSLAVRYALKQMGVEFDLVSRKSAENVRYTYDVLNAEAIAEHQIIINTTPLGMFPKIHDYPRIDYDGIGSHHLLFDLVYNPDKTVFLIKGEQRGATVKSGLEMLQGQAEAAWEIWNAI